MLACEIEVVAVGENTRLSDSLLARRRQRNPTIKLPQVIVVRGGGDVITRVLRRTHD